MKNEHEPQGVETAAYGLSDSNAGLESCKLCCYFKPRYDYEEQDGVGQCRRYPPIELPVIDKETHESCFGLYGGEVDFFRQPYVCEYFWCGEFKPPNVQIEGLAATKRDRSPGSSKIHRP